MKKTEDDIRNWLLSNRPDIVLIGQYLRSSLKIEFLFKKCNHIAQCLISNIRKGQGCPVCAGKQVIYEKSLEFLFPNLAKEWHVNKNIDISPSTVTVGSSRKVWWHCFKCGSDYLAAIRHRTANRSACPYCAGQKVNTTNCLATRFPELVEEWSDKNLLLTPYSVSPMSDKKVWWKYKCGHENQQIICNRTLHGKGCSICGGSHPKTIEDHIKDVYKIHKSNIYIIGNYINNRIKIEYGCNICKYKWFANPYAILSGGGCPVCKLSHGQRKIKNYLDENRIVYELEKRFDDCRDTRPLPFDFYLPGQNVCIEFDGEQHFMPKDCFGGLDNFEDRQRKDLIKNNYCIKKNILLIRIAYLNAKNIEKILCDILRLEQYE